MLQMKSKRVIADVNVPVLGDRVPQRGNWLSRGIGRIVMKLLGWRFAGSIANIPKLVAIGAPHTSQWDVFISLFAFSALGVRVSWMAKESAFWWPLGIILRWTGGISIVRDSKQGVVEQLVAQFNTNEQLALALSPEGTRRKVQRWKTGFYHIAVGANVPIMGVAIDYGTKTITFSAPFHPTGDLETDLPEIQAFFATATAKYEDKRS